MIDIEAIFYQQIKEIIESWNEPGIYAISFYVESNEAIECNGYSNLTNFSVSYNTEADCHNAGPYDEERWNYAFWRHNVTDIVDMYGPNDGAKLLFQWYAENGIQNLGVEEEDCYDEACHYIGKGPVGHYELLTIAANIAARLQREKLIEKKFGKQLPIIVHGLEYPWYDIEATKRANPFGEAETFLQAMEELGMM